MRSKKSNMFLRNALVSLIVVLVLGLLGLAVQAFTTVYSAQFILAAVFIVFVAVLVLYLVLHHPTRQLTAQSLFPEPCFVKR